MSIPPKDHVGLAWSRVTIWCRRNPEWDKDDVFEAALNGLYEGCKRFDETRGVRPSTYVVKWIDEYIRRSRRPLAGVKHAKLGSDPLTYIEDVTKIDAMWKRVAGDVETADDHLSKKEVARLLWEAVQELPPKKRYCVTQYFYEGKTYAEIGSTFGTSRQAVESLIRGTLQFLKTKLTRLHGDFI